MSSKPKKEEHKASELEKTNAAVAAAEKAYFRKNYQPLLTQMRDESLREDDQKRILKDRAQADTMQALTGQRPSLAATQAVDYQSDLASAALGQQMQASRAAKDISTTMQTGVLGTARGQAADAQSGLAAASRMRASRELAETQAKFAARQAKGAMFGQLAGAYIGQGIRNKKATGEWNKSFRVNPGQIDPSTGEVTKTGVDKRSWWDWGG